MSFPRLNFQSISTKKHLCQSVNLFRNNAKLSSRDKVNSPSKGSLAVRKVQFFWTLFKRGRGGQTHVQKLCCKFGVFWRSFNNMKFTTWNSPHDVQTKGGEGGSKAFWTMFKKTALFLQLGFPYLKEWQWTAVAILVYIVDFHSACSRPGHERAGENLDFSSRKRSFWVSIEEPCNRYFIPVYVVWTHKLFNLLFSP